MGFELTNVSFTYSAGELEFQALKNVSLSIKSGEYVAIIGASGSGKTTLMNMLGLLATPSEGQLTINDQPVADLNDDERAILRNKDIGFIFQHFALLPRMTVMENILLSTFYAEDVNSDNQRTLRARALKLLSDFGLSAKEDSYPPELSGGQKQRIAICRALLMNPSILLADEPTGALDTKTSAEVMGMLDSLNAQSKTIIVITHDPKVAAHAQRIVTLKDGAIQSDERVGEPTDHINSHSSATATQTLHFKQSLAEKLYAPFRLQFSVYFAIASRALSDLRANKLRSILTGLGLLIGVISIIVITGLGEIIQTAFTKKFYNSNTLKSYVWYEGDESRNDGIPPWQGLNFKNELSALQLQFAPYGKIRPMFASEGCTLQGASLPTQARVQGLFDANEFTELETKASKGRFPTPLEFQSSAPVAMLGSNLVDSLFAKDYAGRADADFPLGEKVFVKNCSLYQVFTVAGVLAKMDTAFGPKDVNDRLYATVPAMTVGMREQKAFVFTALPNTGVDPFWLADSVKNYLTVKTNGVPFNKEVPAEIIEKIRAMLFIIQGLIAFIGGLCLFVGGIGIMNIMIVTVTERVREIGIMKSLGARSFHIRNQFLIESVLLCIISGIIGIVIGLFIVNVIGAVVALALPEMGDLRLIVSPVGITIGFVVSLLSGVGFGFIPAIAAGRMAPAECLRQE